MSTPAERKSALEAAKHQAMFREVNEHVKTLNEAFESVTHDSQFICECANTRCHEPIVVSLAEYEAVRRIPTHFLVSGPSHVFPDVERIAEQHDEYFVVEKYGEAGEAATRLDPRSPGRAPG